MSDRTTEIQEMLKWWLIPILGSIYCLAEQTIPIHFASKSLDIWCHQQYLAQAITIKNKKRNSTEIVTRKFSIQKFTLKNALATTTSKMSR